MMLKDVKNKEMLADLARVYSFQFSGIRKFLVRHRPKICPFDTLFGYIKMNGSLFDIGCGSGYLMYAHASLNAPALIVGVDRYNPSLKNIEDNLVLSFKDIDIKLIAAEDFMKWPSIHFDIVTMIDVVHHIPVSDQLKFIKAAGDRVKPGGVLIYKDICGETLWSALANRLHDLLFARQWINYISVNKVIKELSEQGFDLQVRTQRIMYVYKHDIIVMTKRIE